MNNCFENIRGKRVFLTGHTGFKGSWLARWLSRLGATVAGFALPPTSSPNHYDVSNVSNLLSEEWMADIRDLSSMRTAIAEFEPDLIMHLAAQSVVSRGYEDPIETISTNVMGTANVLESVRLLRKPMAVMVVTSDKCYHNVEQVWGYREDDALGEKDPYGGSKGAAELIVRSYRNSYFPVDKLQEHGIWLATARAGNVIGGGDWTENALVVDIVQALHRQETIVLRKPGATRPWQHVLQCLSGYLEISDQLLEQKHPRICEAWNIGPAPGNEWRVDDVADKFIEIWGEGNWVCPNADIQTMKEASILRLSIDKAIWDLNWRPAWDVEASIRKTVEWYQSYFQSPESINDLTAAQIDEYQALYQRQKETLVEQPV